MYENSPKLTFLFNNHGNQQKLIDFLESYGEESTKKEPGTTLRGSRRPESDAIYAFEAYRSRAAFEEGLDGASTRDRAELHDSVCQMK